MHKNFFIAQILFSAFTLLFPFKMLHPKSERIINFQINEKIKEIIKEVEKSLTGDVDKKSEREEEKKGKSDKSDKDKKEFGKESSSEGFGRQNTEIKEDVKSGKTNLQITDTIYIITVEGAISPPIADYIVDSIKEGEKRGAKLILILLDTPGGLDTSMRKIIQAIQSSYVPICVYVFPVGARAASAGTFITLSAHIAAMAPGTSIGAASPVLMGGEKMDEKLRKKVENDAVAYIKSIAERHKRNVEWAEKAVRESETLTAEEALRLKVIDIVADNIPDLIKKINGKVIQTPIGSVVLNFQTYELVRAEPNLKHKILKVLADPNIAYILMMIGIWGIFFELANPGAIFPGVMGAISLILGLYALQALPVNWAGLLLILLAIILFLLEVKVASSGILALAGVLSMLLGSLMLFESPEPFLKASYQAVISVTLASAAFFMFVAYKAMRAQLAKPMIGFEALLDKAGEAITDFENGTGKIFINGEIWDAKTQDINSQIKKGEKIKVISHEGITLIVKKLLDEN